MSLQDLRKIIQRYLSTDSRKVVMAPRPPSDIRIACVAAIIRWKPKDQISTNNLQPTQQHSGANNNYHETLQLENFFNQSWIKDGQGQAEMLFIERASRPGDLWSGHIAFPGGKDEPDDKTILDIIIRECKEEIGLDLGSSRDFAFIGTLPHKEVLYSKAHKRPTMILIPCVFVQLTPDTPELTLQQTEVADTYWIPISHLLSNPLVPYSPITNSTGDSPENIHGISLLNNNSGPYLWGMTLRTVQEILGLPISPVPIFSAERIETYKVASKI